MTLTYIDNGLDKNIAGVGEALVKRLNYKNERAQQLASNPATLAALAPAYRHAKEVGQEANFFAGLQVDPGFGKLLDAYPETPEETAQKLKSKVEIAQATSTLHSGIIDKDMQEQLLKTDLGTRMLQGYNTYINDLPDTPLGKHLKGMATIAFSNPGLLDEIQKHEAADNKGNGDPLIEYDRWRTGYNNALDRFRKSTGAEKASAMADLNNMAVIGEQLQAAQKIPLSPITGVREARRFLGLGKKLEEFNITPEVRDNAAVAAHSVVTGMTPDGNKVTIDDLKKSKFYNSLEATDQGKLIAAIESEKGDHDMKGDAHPDKMSYWDAMSMVAEGAGKMAAAPIVGAAKLADKGVMAGLKGAKALGNAMGSMDKLTPSVPNAEAKTPSTTPASKIAAWANKQGFDVTSTVGGIHNTNSLHGKGLAVDVRTKNKTPAEVAKLISEASLRGLRVLDERTRPNGQAVWDGPHIHLEINPSKKPSNEIGLDEYINSILKRLELENK